MVCLRLVSTASHLVCLHADLLATVGSIRGGAVLAGLMGGFFQLFTALGAMLPFLSFTGHVCLGDVVGKAGSASASFCCFGHTCSPMAEI